MKNKTVVYLLFLICPALIAGCASLKVFMNGSTTRLKSDSLAASAALRAQGITVYGSREGNDWAITPTKINGRILSTVLPIASEVDDGVTPFGDGRPDIAPAQSILYDFDLSQTTTLRKDVISTKDTFKGGQANSILLIFGYFDVEFSQGAAAKKVRFCYGDSNVYLRGDKLLYNANGATTNNYYWYSSVEGFVSEAGSRPAAAVYNSNVKNYSDPVRPNMHYYMLGASLRNCTDYDGKTGLSYVTLDKSIVQNDDLAFTVNFDVTNSVIFSGVTSEAAFQALSDAELIQKFDMKQNVTNWSNPGIYCSITFEATPKLK